MDNSRNINEIKQIKQANRDKLFANPDVVSVGIGYRKKKGNLTDEVCIVVGVRRKLPKKQLDASRIIPSELTYYSPEQAKEIAACVDVQEKGMPSNYACSACTTDLESRVRPVPGGFSISGDEGGTLGGWVWDNVTGQVVLLSNEHVLGDTGGTDVLQPSFTDGGVAADHFADVLRAGTLDAAIAVPIDVDDIEYNIECVGPAVYETAEPTLGMVVEKTGQTTAHTCGTVPQIAIDVGHYGSRNDFEVYTDTDGVRFAYYGDSGSLVVEQNDGAAWKRVIGLLWGGDPSDYNAYAHPINDVFGDLNLATVCASLTQASEFGEPEIRGLSQFESPGSGMRRSFARLIERRLLKYSAGKELVDLVHQERTEVVRFFADAEGQRALARALVPMLKGKHTTLDVLNHAVTQEDVENVNRVLELAKADYPNMKKSVKLVSRLLRDATGRAIKDLLK
jgi:hypothetical protein